eukprot:gi/632970778/ref/XP_007901836.1/ PREDICTED: alpha-2A adrenergic receptor [Callorhinchus milii]
MPSPRASPTSTGTTLGVGTTTSTTNNSLCLWNCSSSWVWNGTPVPVVGEGEVYPLEPALALISVVSLMIVAIIFGNVLVVIAVFTSRGLRAPQNLFLVSLASADILVATLVMPFSLANELMGYWYFGPVWCEIYLALDVLFCTSSIVHLCAISLDRYWSITQAVQYNLKRTPRRIKCIIVVVWVIAAVISFPPLVPIGKETGQEQSPNCRINEEVWYVISSCIGSFFAPCIIMILVYVRIYQIAKVRTRHPPGGKRCQEDGRTGVPAGVGAAAAAGGGGKQNGFADKEMTASKPAANGSNNGTELGRPGPPARGRRGREEEEEEDEEDGFKMDESTSSDHQDAKSPRGHPAQRHHHRVSADPANASPAGLGGQAEPGQPGDKGASGLDRTGGGGGGRRRGRWRGRGPGRGGQPQGGRWRGRQNREKRFTFVLSVVIGVFIVMAGTSLAN